MHQTKRITIPIWLCRNRGIALDPPLVMGILNVTPDSFSDGGRYIDPEHAVERALAMIEAGADIVDIGGESTRPGAETIDEAEELRRVLPVIRKLTGRVNVPLSIDTRHPAVAQATIDAGVLIINTVAPFTGDTAMAKVARETGAGLVLTHSRGTPQTMMAEAHYDNVVASVEAELQEALTFALEQGISRDACVIDPGLGFAKDTQQNICVLAALNRLTALGPLLIGASRKRFIGEICKEPDAARRLGGSLCVAVWSILHGASIIRAHDVKETKESLALALALKAANSKEKKPC